MSPAQIELKVGLIRECQKHPDADMLYVSQIVTSLGKEEGEQDRVLTVCSGLVNYVPRVELINKKVVVVTNLKPSKMRGIKSEAMLLAADRTNSEDHTEVEVVNAPEGSLVGDELHFGNFKPEGGRTKLKPKVWQELQKQLSTNSEGVVIFRDSEGNEHSLSTEKGSAAFVHRLTDSSVR